MAAAGSGFNGGEDNSSGWRLNIDGKSARRLTGGDQR